jgi:hypothetical protein
LNECGGIVLIRDIFETKIEDKIEPVIKVGERKDEHKLAEEIGSYVITPTIEKFLDDFLEHYTDTFRIQTSEMGVWISGYFGSGKSHLAKIASLLIENRSLEGITASKRFESRLPSDCSRRESIIRCLSRLHQCDSGVLAFNLNSLEDNKTTPLPRLLLSQYYQSKGYSSNLLYARVIEAELDRRGKLGELHSAAERLAQKSWTEMMKRSPSFYSKYFYQAACEVAPEIFEKPEDVAQALKSAERGELYNVQFLVRTIFEDLMEREKATGKYSRFVFVMDEAGQWIGDDGNRLSQLQALVEEADINGQGRIWIFATTHEDMGSIYQNAKMLKGDFKKIEARFRNKIHLTTENIEKVLEDRIFKKKIAGKDAVIEVYNMNPGVLRSMGELVKTSQKLPECSEKGFCTFYPFFPYQIHLIPEMVKSLRSAGGRVEQMSGSTRTLLAITQDILRAGRRKYLDLAVGEIVSFDEVYHNLAGEGEIKPDARRELSRIEEVVPDSTALTRRVAEVLYLMRGVNYIPRTTDNISRLLVEHSTEDLSAINNRVCPELNRLINAGLVAKIGEEYEFLTGVVRTFEEEVAEERSTKLQYLEAGLSKLDLSQILGFNTINFKGGDFPVKVFFDDNPISKDGAVKIKVYSPLAGFTVSYLEDLSLGKEEEQTIFVISSKVLHFEESLSYYIAMVKVINDWKGDPHKSDDAHKVASEREAKDLGKLREKIVDGLREGLKNARVVFRGSTVSLVIRNGQLPEDALRSELAALFWPKLYPNYINFQIIKEQQAILDALNSPKSSSEVYKLGIYDKIGQIDQQSKLIDSICSYLSVRQSRNERTLGADLISEFYRPPYGWDTGAVRVATAALVRSGSVVVHIDKRAFTNPADSELQNALRRSTDFNRVELILEGGPDLPILEEVRKLLIGLTGKRKIDETPAALAEVMTEFGSELIKKARDAKRWAEPACLPLPSEFKEGIDGLEKILDLKNPNQMVREINTQKDHLRSYMSIIRSVSAFIDKKDKSFIEMRDFANSLKAIEHRISETGDSRSFLENWKTALTSSGVIEDTNWRDLQASMSSARLEIDKLTGQSKEEARKRAQEAVDRLPQDIASHGLPADFQQSLSKPLKDFIASIGDVIEFYHIFALSDRVSGLILGLGEAIRREQEKQKGPMPPPSKRPVRRLRITDVITVGRIRDVEQWNRVRDQLDESVKRELGEGKDVELI